jgi:hypothetical protein
LQHVCRGTILSYLHLQVRQLSVIERLVFSTMVTLNDVGIHPRLHPFPKTYFVKDPIKSAFESRQNHRLTGRAGLALWIQDLTKKIMMDIELVFFLENKIK